MVKKNRDKFFGKTFVEQLISITSLGSKYVTNSSHDLTNFFLEFFSVWAVEKENKQVIFPQYASWKKNHNKYSLKKCRFGIGD